jgi:hypothetical protein
MTKIIIGLFIFCLVLFLYLHLQFHLKTSEDIEMYEVDQPSKERLEEICDIRQPVLFDFECDKIVATTNKNYIVNNYSNYEVKIRNVNENDPNAELYVPLPLHTAVKLFEGDTNSSFITEHNRDFLNETTLLKNFKYNDHFLRPYMVSKCSYDILAGSPNVCTPFRYEINYRNYLLLTQGRAQIKLAPPHNIKNLYTEYDYENFEFRSPINPWAPQPKYKSAFEKVRCIEFTLLPGKTLFIPAYWWYSIKFIDSNTSISCFHYRTYMNTIAILPYIALNTLQLQNIKRNSAQKSGIQTSENTVLEDTVLQDNILEDKQPEENSEKNLGTSINDLPVNNEQIETPNE